MKKIWIGIVNVLIMILIVVFVMIYTNSEHEKLYKNQIELFESTAIRMNNMTENYLKSEQDICDNWANYINSEELTINEAIDFTTVSKKSAYASAHIIFKDSLKGLSTTPSIKDNNDYNVSYKEISLFNNTNWISDEANAINVSRAFTNQLDAIQSMAFCRKIKLKEDSGLKDAYLLRVIPVSTITDKWQLTKEGASNIELSLVDKSGNYIIRDSAYKNSNFFEFFKSYNSINSKNLEELKDDVINNTGFIEMNNSFGKKCIIAHTPVKNVGGWVLLSYTEADYLKVNNDNFVLVGIVSFGLLILFVIDLIYLRHFYMKLKYLSKEADKANKAKTDFLSTMSHDIRTPMNAIVGLTALTEKNINDKEKVKEYNKKIALASNHLLTLINDILDISKVESGKISLNPMSFSIIELIDNLINMTDSQIKNKNIDFKFDKQHIKYEYLYADKLRLNQIFINILSNAIKYTDAFGKINASITEEEIKDSEYVKLIYVVKDTGIGMSKEFMERMYDPFIRETDSRINTIEGTGLGLSITKKMVDLMDGSIECESELGKGTKFIVTLNIKKDLSKENIIINNQINDYVDIANMNVLIAEDNDINYEILSELLKSYNVNTFRASNGKICLDMIKESKENQYDLIFMDIQMPIMNGLDVTKEIRLLNNWAKNIPIYAISADAFSENINECLEVGMNGHIAKPIDINIVLEKLREVKK